MFAQIKQLHRQRRNLRKMLKLADLVHADLLASGLPPCNLVMVPSDTLLAAGDVLIKRQGDGFALHFSNQTSRGFLPPLFGKISAFIHWLREASPEISETLVDCTDGEGPSNARYDYSVNRAGTVALPDVYFTRSQGYAAFDARFRELNIP